MEASFYGNSKKHAISKPRASLITTFFRARYRVPPTLNQILTHAAPTQKPQKNNSERKNEMKSQESLPTAIHIHGALHARQQPEAKTNKMTSTFSRSKIQKIKIGIGIHKTISQTQAQRQANTQVKNHTVN